MTRASMPDQMDVLKMLLAYERMYGPISSRGIENLADWVAGQLRDFQRGDDE